MNLFKRKISFVFAVTSLLFFSISCDKIPSNVVLPKLVDYRITQVNFPSRVVYSPSDSVVVASIRIENPSSVSEVWMTIKSLDGTITLYDKINFYDNGKGDNGDLVANDGIFSAAFKMSKTFSNGKYVADIYVVDNVRDVNESTKHVAETIFEYDNNQIQFPPVLSNLKLPSAINRGVNFIFSIEAYDQNGLNDIKYVYFKLYRPDGSLVDPNNGLGFFLMNDKGDPNYGDAAANDGIFSFQNSFSSNAPIGQWKFEFQAVDWEGNLSNIVTQTIQVN
ncbi:hypothetical protein ABRY23_08350 [Melioribacteraceae bacterium 4301-Me]|uniref:hypothetical protein n=1 Tax=Pyranulibacter aquaticus TaxID=3163344 RepID=UPI0035960FAC